ncbi:DUF481 domain-containing protein [bacterium]|nr:DUF481 domain-containing protein [bacterium]
MKIIYNSGDALDVLASIIALVEEAHADYRLLNETNMLYKLNKNLSLSLDIEYRFDSDPPSLLTNKDLNSNLGLVIVF